MNKNTKRQPRAFKPSEDIYGLREPATGTFSSGCTLLDMALGGGWAYSRMGNIIGDKCLAGDTIVSAQRGGKPKKMTLETLYKRVNGKHHNRKPDVETLVLCDLGGHVGMHRVKEIYASGTKVLFRITDEHGQSIDASADHRFLTPDGWVTVNDGLCVGTSVVAWRGKKTGKGAKPNRAVTHSIPFHPHGWQHVIAGRNYKRMATARLVIEAAMNGLGLDEFVRILRNDSDRAAGLDYSDPRLEVHHLDGNPENDSIANLELLHSEKHWAEHADDMARDTNRTVLVRIEKIEKLGKKPTYDIEMDGPHHNFIANGFVVHNSSGKTLLVIEAAANFIRENPDGKVVYAEAEAAFDKGYAESLGLPLQHVEFPPNISTIEDLFEDLDRRMVRKSKHKTLYIIDSLDALSDRAEAKREIDQNTFGQNKQKQIGALFRRMIMRFKKSSLTMLIVSQVRDKIGIAFGDTLSRSGGRAMDFYATHALWLSHLGQIHHTKKGVKRTVGVRIKANVKKNKIGPAFRTCSFPIIFGFGVDDVAAGLEFLIEVRRTNAVGMSIEGAKKFSAKLDSLPAKDYQEARKTVNEAVREVWADIEESFKVQRRKYEVQA